MSHPKSKASPFLLPVVFGVPRERDVGDDADAVLGFLAREQRRLAERDHGKLSALLPGYVHAAAAERAGLGIVPRAADAPAARARAGDDAARALAVTGTPA